MRKLSATGAQKRKGRSKVGRPTKAEAEARNQRVLEIAKELFFRHGFDGTTHDQIAKSAGVAKLTLYQTLGDKIDIFNAVFRQKFIEPDLFIPVDAIDKKAPEKTLKMAAQKLVERYTSEESIRLRRLATAEAMRFPDLMQTIQYEGISTIYNTIAYLLAQMDAKNLLRIDNPLKAAKIFADLVVGLSYMHVPAGVRSTLPTSFELDEKIAMFVQFYSG